MEQIPPNPDLDKEIEEMDKIRIQEAARKQCEYFIKENMLLRDEVIELRRKLATILHIVQNFQ